METDKKILLNVQLPTWFLYLYFGCAVGSLAIISASWLRLLRDGVDWSDARPWKGLLLVVILLIVCLIALIFLSSVLVTANGFETHGIRGLRRKVRWDDITRVSLPRFGIPYEAIYIFLKDGEKITVMKSMKNVGELLQFIDAKARHARIDDDVLPYMT